MVLKLFLKHVPGPLLDEGVSKTEVFCALGECG